MGTKGDEWGWEVMGWVQGEYEVGMDAGVCFWEVFGELETCQTMWDSHQGPDPYDKVP